MVQVVVESVLIVLAHQHGQPIERPRAHRRDNRVVLALGLARAHGQHVAEEVAAHLIPAVEGLHRHLQQHRQAGHRRDGDVELRVEVAPHFEAVALHDGVHLAHQAIEIVEVAGRRPLGRHARGDDLQALHDREDVENRVARQRRDGRADVRHAFDQALRLQQLERLAHRNGADIEALREVLDDQPLARPQLASQDRAANGAVDELLLGAMRRAGLSGQWHGG